jgi:galactose mutarotase-like enzyme
MLIYSVSNKNISISVNSVGAELTSLKTSNTELLWQSDKAVWARYAPVLFPIVGKLKNDQFNYNNAAYKLTQHGFARDREFTLIGQTGNMLEFELTADAETLEKYPFHFSLRIRYELEETALKVNYLVFNPDKRDLLFSIGAHPGFNCKRVDGENLNDFYLEFENSNDLIREKLSDGLLSGERSVVKLNDRKLKLNTALFEEDALVFKNKQIESVKLCSVKSKQQIIMNCKDWPYFGIWTKKGSDAFVCLEPWHGIADHVNFEGELSKKEGIIHIKGYQTFEAFFELRVD